MNESSRSKYIRANDKNKQLASHFSPSCRYFRRQQIIDKYGSNKLF